VTLKQLEAFYWAATYGSFIEAAKRLHLSQSSLSKRIAELESSLGCTLFDRDFYRATLTSKGRQLLPKAKELLAHAEEIVISLETEDSIRGSCRFGVGEIAASSWLPKLISSGRRLYPELSLEPYVELGRELEARLMQGDLDFAMVANQSLHPSLESVAIANVQFTWVVSSDISHEHGSRIEDLALSLPIVTMHSNAGSSTILDRWLKENDLRDVKLIVCNNMTTMAGLVASGIGIGYFPKSWIRPLLDRNILTLLNSDIPLPPLEYRFCWRKDDKRLLIQRMKDLVMKEVDYNQAIFML
jgi:DNA-binding transcriptional LysR family regulator